jgi:hypothetical protein
MLNTAEMQGYVRAEISLNAMEVTVGKFMVNFEITFISINVGDV